MPEMESLHQTNENTDAKVVVHNTNSLYRYWVWLKTLKVAIDQLYLHDRLDPLQIMKPHRFTTPMFQAQVSCSFGHLKPWSPILLSTWGSWVSFQRAIKSKRKKEKQNLSLRGPRAANFFYLKTQPENHVKALIRRGRGGECVEEGWQGCRDGKETL